MGTNRSREEKIKWMLQHLKLIKDDDLLIRTFCVRFFSTRKTAIEILSIVRDTKLVNKKLT